MSSSEREAITPQEEQFVRMLPALAALRQALDPGHTQSMPDAATGAALPNAASASHDPEEPLSTEAKPPDLHHSDPSEA